MRTHFTLLTFLSVISASATVALAKPSLPAEPSDAQLRKLFLAEKPSFVKLEEMLLSDKALRNLKRGLVNSSEQGPVPLPEALRKAEITPERYQEYLELLDRTHCQGIGYGTSYDRNGAVVDNRQEILYLASRTGMRPRR